MGAWWVEAAAEEYRYELWRLVERHPALEEVDEKDLSRFARRGAQATVAPLLWAEAVGDRLDTRAVTLLLGVTRQALAQRVAAGSLLGLPGQGTTWFPTWQFDRVNQPARVRPVVPRLLATWREVLGSKYDPLLVASWAASPQRGELQEATPAEWIEGDGPEQPLLLAAKRAVQGVLQ